jgi:hypothetical protein
MSTLFTYRGRTIAFQDVAFIRELIAANPQDHRSALSRRLCQAWDWTQPNGRLKEMICRGLLLRLHREGYINLPPPRQCSHNPFLDRRRPEPIEIDTTAIRSTVKQLAPRIVLQQVRRTPLEKMFNSLIEQYHYLGYSQPVGEHVKYIAFADTRPIGCLAFSSAAFGLKVRDHFIGWEPAVRDRNRHLLAYNTRFLLLPWVEAKFLASHLLAKCARQIASDWQALYHHPIYWLETFVDTARFKGTCYKAANWLYLGKTEGRGKYNKTHKQLTSIKAIYGLPLDSAFRTKLCQ